MRKFSNYKTINLAQLIFLTTVSFMGTYFYFSNQLTESKTTKESLKQSITEKRIFAISPKNYDYVYFLLKKPITLFCFFMCLMALNWTRDFLSPLIFNTLQHSFPLLLSYPLPHSFSLLCSLSLPCFTTWLCSIRLLCSSLYLSFHSTRYFSIVSDNKVLTTFL